ncbi:MAG TPA: hypothetical protein VHW00_18815 [Thermoanaerobaculia bacterium]|nr:hypothetical protein [Thermoanaerobaculia bacterium]
MRYLLEDMRFPTLVIGTEPTGAVSAPLSRSMTIHDEFVGFINGGHLLRGHEAEVRSEILNLFERASAARGSRFSCCGPSLVHSRRLTSAYAKISA